MLHIWKKHCFVCLGIRKKTIGYSNSILRDFLSAGLSFCGKQEKTMILSGIQPGSGLAEW